MNKLKVLFYDDESEYYRILHELLDKDKFELITFKSFDELRETLNNRELISQSKALIFDLAQNNKESEQTRDFEILKDIREKFNQYRIPIIIHSAYAKEIDDFKNCGTVWKIVKSGESLEQISSLLSTLDDSGFLDAFTPGGLIEESLMIELHKSFTEQFREGDIEKIIQSVKDSGGGDFKSRTINIFKRTAIKSLSNQLLAPVADSQDKVHPVEHFYRRQSKLDIWTGDIWKNSSTKCDVVVLTPRCDFAVGKAESIVFCNIEPAPDFMEIGEKKRPQHLINHLIDNIDGKSKRYIPRNSFYPDGGMVNMGKHQMLDKNEFLKLFSYVVTLSDDLTNEIIGKFAYYFLRTGITNINEKEFEAIIKTLNPNIAEGETKEIG